MLMPRAVLRRHRRVHWVLDQVLIVVIGVFFYFQVRGLAHADPSVAVQYAEELARGDKTIVMPAQDGLSDGEKQAMDLMLQGERKTAAFARVLQVEHLPDEEQRRVVYRIKNKLKKRIERGRGNDGQES